MPFVIFNKEQNRSEIHVRAVIATLFALGVVIGFFCGKISAEVFTTFASVAVTWYFSKRDNEEQTPSVR